jgi:hypothetical protein
MIRISEIRDPDERLNLILDKISKEGVKSLEKKEIEFLKSYSLGLENETNKKLSEEESRTTFISDDGNFTFVLSEIEEVEDIKFIHGIIYVPDLKIRGNKIIRGELKGSIIYFNDNNIAIDFRHGKYDIFEFVYGLEYELDCFIDDLVFKLTK